MSSAVIFEGGGVLVDSEGGEAFPDATETVATLALFGIPLAVVSPPSVFGDVGLARYFEVTVAGSEALPDLYLEAAERLGVVAASCLVVTSSGPTATAATAAGMRVVAVDRDGGSLGSHTTVSSLDAELIRVWLGV